jgi:hypothetical protein
MLLLTRTRLASALLEADAPPQIIADVANGHYDDYRFPKIALLDDLYRAGLHELAQRIIAGEFS